MSYIEREPLLKMAKELQGKPFGAPLIVRAIESAPTVDGVEVRHGEWCSYEGYCECPLCHHKYVNTSLYCPNCGAKMDGERRTN